MFPGWVEAGRVDLDSFQTTSHDPRGPEVVFGETQSLRCCHGGFVATPSLRGE